MAYIEKTTDKTIIEREQRRFEAYEAEEAVVLAKLDHINQQFRYLAVNNSGIEKLVEKSIIHLKSADKFFQQVNDNHFQDHCGGNFHKIIKDLTDTRGEEYRKKYSKTLEEIQIVKSKMKKVMKEYGAELENIVNKMNGIYYGTGGAVGYLSGKPPIEDLSNEQ